MAWLYHLKPDTLKGNTLYPLSQLKQHYPELYEEERAKYQGREHVLTRTIPPLDCEWQDILHLTAVHPAKIKEAANIQQPIEIYKIGPTRLDPETTTVYRYDDLETQRLRPDDFDDYHPKSLDQYAELPERTKQYYQDQLNKGNDPLLFVGIPHILYRENLSVEASQTITI